MQLKRMHYVPKHSRDDADSEYVSYQGSVGMSTQRFLLRDTMRKRGLCCGTLIGSQRRRIDPCRFRWPWV